MGSTSAEVGIDLSVVADFRGAAAGGSLLGMGVGVDGTVVAILGDRPRSAYAAGRPARGALADAALYVRPGEPVRRVQLEPVELHSVRPQPLPDGGVVVVEARPRDPENVTVFGPDGRVRERFAVGDGVEEAMLDGAGELWVGYFDERVSSGGAYSGEPDGDEHAETGLNRFDLSGRRSWSYACDRVGRIYHCYALNVAADAVWAVIYSDAFELIRVGGGGEIDAWGRLGTAGWTRGILVDGENVLVVGAHEGRSSAALWRLDEKPELLQTFRLQAPRGFPAPEHAETYGRGSTLYLPEDGVCYSLTLRR